MPKRKPQSFGYSKPEAAVSSSLHSADGKITEDTIIAAFRQRRGTQSRMKFWQEVVRVTGMKLSYSHLANMLSGKRPPNDVVLKYLGLERVEGYRGVQMQ